MPESFRERVDTSSAIKGILDSYPFGNGLLREILQNSDDAGAKHQIFVLDRRQHRTTSLIDPALAATQGPSVLCYNDSIFRESDWKALQTIHGSNKTADETKIGKYGLGFRSTYHVTDNPHILSGSRLVVFDPQEEFQDPNKGGIAIDFVTEGAAFSDQLAAFEPLLVNPAHFPGTIVRLPLRTAEQASMSRIKNQSFTPDDIKQLMHDFTQNEMAVTMMFLKHILSIELQEIDAEGNVSVLGRVSVEDPNAIVAQRAFERGRNARFESFQCVFSTPSGQRTWRICHSVLDAEETTSIMSKRLGYDLGSQLADDKLFSHVAVAYPLDASIERGRLFTLLPLPIYTDFPLHLHGILALTPDRQSLRNKEETGLNNKTRERLLVEWNSAIFDTFTPRLWVQLLEILIREDLIRDIWAAWPPAAASHPYWSALAAAVAQEAASPERAIFPRVEGTPGEALVYVPLRDAFIAPPEADIAVLRTLSRAGCIITQPPPSVYGLILPHRSRAFDLTEIRSVLLANRDRVIALPAPDKYIILDYLLSPGHASSLKNILDIPIIPTVNSTFTSFSLSSDALTLASEDEEQLFASFDTNMVSLARMRPRVSALIGASGSASVLNVRHLRASDVVQYLQEKYGQLDPVSPDVLCTEFSEHLQWLGLLWNWANSNSAISLEMPFFKSRTANYHLFPTATNSLRQVSSGFLNKGNLPPDTIATLKSSGIPFLHEDVDHGLGIFTRLGALRPAADVGFVLDNLFSTLSPSAVPIFQHYFLSSSSTAAGKLNARQRAALLSLPIFPTTTGRGVVVYAPVVGRAIFLSDISGPLPILKETTYLDVSPLQGLSSLASYVNASYQNQAIGEVGILQLAIPVLGVQEPQLIDLLTDRIISRFLDLPQASLDVLASQPFVLVGSGDRRPPHEVVDPSSSISQLYAGESARFPAGQYQNQKYLGCLRPHLIHKLTQGVIEDRIRFVSQSADIDKTQCLLRLLDVQWSDPFAGTIQAFSARSWVPGKDDELHAPAECCCAVADERIFDLVLPAVSAQIASAGLRSALGWDGMVPFSTVLEQLRRAIDLPQRASIRHARVIAVINDLARRTPTASDVSKIQEVILGKNWTPVEGYPCSLVDVRHAYIDEEVEVGGVFRRLHSSLCNEGSQALVRDLGCTQRPSFEALVSELHGLRKREDHLNPRYIIRILEELTLHSILDLPGEQREQILLLASAADHTKSLQPFSSVYFNDLPSEPRFLDHPHRLTNLISRNLAQSLGVPFASALNLDLGWDYDDDDGIDMGEDFCVRIRGVLKEYDIGHDFNEFAANAIDAGATTFSICLDTRQSFPAHAGTVISPQSAKFNQRQSILLYNDAVFSDKDFVGIRKTGQGGKADEADTIGRFGLGALTMFHFSDLPMIISGKHVLFLDPSGEYLPRQGGRRRTALLRPISSIAARCPDQLKPVESIFGFSSTSPEFHGTIFRLPLRQEASQLSDKLLFATNPQFLDLITTQYYNVARSSLLFTPLQQVFATKIGAVGHTRLWSVVRHHSEEHVAPFPLTMNASTQAITVHHWRGDETFKEEKWLISSSTLQADQVPSNHHDVLDKQKLLHTKRGIQVGIAAELIKSNSKPGELNQPQRNLFYSLVLPIVTSLPVHLNASFVLAPDRRNIRLDAPDNSGHRPAESTFNAWILSQLVPQLYMYHLAMLAHQLNINRWNLWPAVSKDPVSEIIVSNFYQQFSRCDFPICVTPNKSTVKPSNAHFSLAFDPPREVRDVVAKLGSSTFVRPSSEVRKLCANIELRRADATFVRNTMLEHAEVYKTLWSKDWRTASVDAILSYFLQSKISPMGLQLLQLQNGELRSFHPDITSPVLVHGTDLLDFFPGTDHRFLARDYTKETVKLLLSDPTLGVRQFDRSSLTQFISAHIPASERTKLSISDGKWVMKIWKAIHDPTLIGINPSDLPEFRRLPLILTHLEGTFVSLEFASSNGVMAPSADMETWLAEALSSLGIVLLQDKAIYRHVISREVLSLHVLVSRLSATAQLALQVLSPSMREKLASWIREHILGASLTRETRVQLRNVPAWPARTDNGFTLACANDIAMLPRSVPLGTIQRYLVSLHPITEYSQALKTLDIAAQYRTIRVPKRRGRAAHDEQVIDQPSIPLRAIDSSNITSYIRLPHSLTQEDINPYMLLIEALVDLGTSSGVKVPDGSLTLRPIEELYDHSIDLFMSCFRMEPLRESNFLYGSFRRLHLKLRRLGLRHEVNGVTLLACARAIHDDSSPSDDATLHSSSQKVFEQYCSTLPSQFMSNSHQWAQFDQLRFIPRAPRSGLQGIMVESYCNDLPHIVSPAQIVLSNHLEVCWTQKAIWNDARSNAPGSRINTSNLTALNKTLGLPTAEDVVNHLHVLSQRVASDHPRNAQVLSSIKATYNWLQQHIEEVVPLMQRSNSERLFLNVEDPNVGPWEWQSANALVFDLDWDSDTGRAVGVRAFLSSNYRELLKACGVKTLSKPSFTRATVDANVAEASIRSRFNDLRRVGSMTDLVFRPMQVPEEDSPELHAHSAFLAVMIPHIRDALESGMAEHASGIFGFQGTHFVARAILDFVYTGDIVISEQPESGEGLTKLLEQILDILPSADAWSMPELKTHVGLLVDRHGLLTPDTYSHILATARLYHAGNLISYCQDYEEKNGEVLQRINDGVHTNAEG